MAQRLEAALRRPAGDTVAPTVAPEPMGDDEMEAAPPPRPPVPAEPARREPRPARADPRAAAAPPQRSLYDSLEQEMASLLGRPNTKP